MSYYLIDAVERLGNPRILVLGDLILDRYIWGEADRISQEAPVILLSEEKRETRLGGAANVANLLRGLEAEVTMSGLVGADFDAKDLRVQLEGAGVCCDGLLEVEDRPTTVKERFLGRAQHRHPHQMLRVDREVRTPLGEEDGARLIAKLLPLISEHAAILISDYAKGVCTPQVIGAIVAEAKKHGIPVLVDPPAHGNWDLYKGVTAITPNRAETGRAVGFDIDSIEDASRAGQQLCRDLELDHAYITIDRDGVVLARASEEGVHHPTRKREVCDITGAGDTVLAMIGIGMAAGIDPENLSKLSNVAGGLQVEQVGVVLVHRNEILGDLLASRRHHEDKICELVDLKRQLHARRRLDQKIVFTNGCFDLLHVGHVSYLKQASQEGDCLIVALNSDESVRMLDKAPDRPLFSQDDRATMLASLESVDYVIIFNDATPNQLLKELQPDLLVKGGTYSKDEIVGKEVVEAYGGEVKPLTIVAGLSTTNIVERLRQTPTEPVAPTTFTMPTKPPVTTPNPLERKAG
ncbi:Bifunctional protein HldE [Polystyrenella longa]|uniref:Bifunctional protein HldE n=1 Tax=Polystyrenella longa TaxID=2528007 RepID=A0A518CPR5_9PLAN|nr:D-glycero-beta-D-manno-heptose 1-phosphate adenylyltransferase [Polystyrenella longa]QDU81217.1 Bifunctional protein HldE [Polystyrenella longa]